MSDFEPRRERSPDFGRCLAVLADALKYDARARAGRDDITTRIVKNVGGARVYVIDERRLTSAQFDAQLNLLDLYKDELHLQQGDYPYVWEFLSLWKDGDVLSLGMQAVNTEAQRQGFGSAALEKLYVAAREAGFRFVASEPIDDVVAVWHLRHGEYADYEVQSNLRDTLKRSFDDVDFQQHLTIRILQEGDRRQSVRAQYVDMPIEVRIAEYERRLELERYLLLIAYELGQLAGRLETGKPRLGDLITAQEVTDDLRKLVPELNTVPDDETEAIATLRGNTKYLEAHLGTWSSNTDDLAMVEACLDALL